MRAQVLYRQRLLDPIFLIFLEAVISFSVPIPPDYSGQDIMKQVYPVVLTATVTFGQNSLYSIILEQGRTIMITCGGLSLTNMKILYL